jgi:hypothetical protein
MGKRSNHNFKKLQKELERKKKAEEKMARRQGRQDQSVNEAEDQESSD